MTRARFLLIGAGGLVGSHLLRTLEGREVVATYRRSPAPGGHVLDITDANAVSQLVRQTRPRVILLAAAEPYVEKCEREPEETRLVNVGGTRHVASAAGEADAALVVFSSEYVFDGTQGIYFEHDRASPLNEYGRQKLAVEELVSRLPRHLVIRTSGVYGAEPARKNFVWQVVDRVGSGAVIRVATDQLITPTYAPSLAKAVVDLILAGEVGTFHVPGPRVLPRHEFARIVAGAFSLDISLVKPVPTSELGLAAVRPARAGLADDKLQCTINRATTSLEEGLLQLASRSPS